MVLRANGSPESAQDTGVALAPGVPDRAAVTDVDGLLTTYRRSRAQRPLFDVRDDGFGAGYDELVDSSGEVRPTWRELAEGVGERGP